MAAQVASVPINAADIQQSSQLKGLGRIKEAVLNP
jgi:hypothetical protein